MLWQALQDLRGRIRAYADELDEGAEGDMVGMREASTMNQCATALRAILNQKETP